MRQKLFDHMHDNHGLILTQSEMIDIENVVVEGSNNPQTEQAEASNTNDGLCCEPTRQQLDEVCEWIPRLEYKTASLVDRQIMRGRAAAWLRAWQHILAT